MLIIKLLQKIVEELKGRFSIFSCGCKQFKSVHEFPAAKINKILILTKGFDNYLLLICQNAQEPCSYTQENVSQIGFVAIKEIKLTGNLFFSIFAAANNNNHLIQKLH